MLRIITIIMLGALVGCAVGPQPGPQPGDAEVANAGLTVCPAERPMICTLDYRPTCAELKDGSRREFANPCNACADPAVIGTYQGPCESE